MVGLLVIRHQQKLHCMHKVNNSMVPTYIADLIPPLVCEISGYSLRNNNNFFTPFTQTNVSTRSCILSAIRIWNNLVESLKTKPTISSFKYNLQTTTFQKIQVPSYFAFGKRHMSVLNVRIRNNCNNLSYISVIIPFVVGAMKQRMVNTTCFIATNTETSVTNS